MVTTDVEGEVKAHDKAAVKIAKKRDRIRKKKEKEECALSKHMLDGVRGSYLDPVTGLSEEDGSFITHRLGHGDPEFLVVPCQQEHLSSMDYSDVPRIHQDGPVHDPSGRVVNNPHIDYATLLANIRAPEDLESADESKAVTVTRANPLTYTLRNHCVWNNLYSRGNIKRIGSVVAEHHMVPLMPSLSLGTYSTVPTELVDLVGLNGDKSVVFGHSLKETIETTRALETRVNGVTLLDMHPCLDLDRIDHYGASIDEDYPDGMGVEYLRKGDEGKYMLFEVELNGERYVIGRGSEGIPGSWKEIAEITARELAFYAGMGLSTPPDWSWPMNEDMGDIGHVFNRTATFEDGKNKLSIRGLGAGYITISLTDNTIRYQNQDMQFGKFEWGYDQAMVHILEQLFQTWPLDDLTIKHASIQGIPDAGSLHTPTGFDNEGLEYFFRPRTTDRVYEFSVYNKDWSSVATNAMLAGVLATPLVGGAAMYCCKNPGFLTGMMSNLGLK